MKRLWKGILGMALSLGAQQAYSQELPTKAPAVKVRAPEPVPVSETRTSVTTAVYRPEEMPAFQIVRAQGSDSFGGPAPVGAVPPPPPYPSDALAGAPSDERFNCAVKVNSSSAQGLWDQTRETISGVPQAFG